MKAIFCVTLSVFFASLSLASARAGTFVYVSVGNANEVAIYQLDPSTGELDAIGRVSTEENPGAMTVDPAQRRLYVSQRGPQTVGVFEMNSRDGQLKSLQNYRLDEGRGGAAYLFADDSSRYLLAANYADGHVASYSLGDDGLVSGHIQTIHNGPKAHCIRTDPSGRYAYCPHPSEVNRIDVYRFDQATGRLTPSEPAFVPQPHENIGPRHFMFHPEQPWVYFDNEQEGSVTTYRFDDSNGYLTQMQKISTLPDDFEGQNTCADIEVHPSGRFVYASNRGHDSIAGFEIDQESGMLRSIGQFPTEATPRSFNITDDGTYMVAAGQKSGNLAVYRISAESGELTRLHTYEVGPSPGWVECVTQQAGRTDN